MRTLPILKNGVEKVIAKTAGEHTISLTEIRDEKYLKIIQKKSK